MCRYVSMCARVCVCVSGCLVCLTCLQGSPPINPNRFVLGGANLASKHQHNFFNFYNLLTTITEKDSELKPISNISGYSSVDIPLDMRTHCRVLRILLKPSHGAARFCTRFHVATVIATSSASSTAEPVRMA